MNFVNLNFINQAKKLLGHNLLFNQPMKNHTTFKIGGPADVLCMPSAEELLPLLSLCKQYKQPFFVMGNGSNLLVGDGGIDGVVIKTSTRCNNISQNGTQLHCGCGALLSAVAQTALKSGLSGFEFAAGIPGTVGAAVAINAGAYGGEMKDVTMRTNFIDYTDLTEQRIYNDQHMFGYRSSVFCADESKVITDCVLEFQSADQQQIAQRMKHLSTCRREKQPLDFPSAGSVFKRPPGYYAGKLIEDSGLRGASVGGAQVSEKHCGFIINRGGATANDVSGLIEHIRQVVGDKFGVDLSTEIKKVGKFT